MKTTKKAFIAVSMIGFAAMMFSCAGTNKNAPSAQEATDRTVLEEAPAETPAEENLPEQNALQEENPAAVQEEVPQNNDVSTPVAQ
ncbi:MAG: hypothetical protein Q4P16_09965 [Spirochaetales bacterium]|nr:hypothetical protein [Spirochaetales bacterium]